MKTILISLEQDKDRRNNAISILKKYNFCNNFEWLKAIHGKDDVKYYEFIKNNKFTIFKIVYNNKTKFYHNNLRLNGNSLSKGELGCSLSHLEIYEMLCKDNNNNSYLIFEDDLNIIVSKEEFNKFMNNLPDINSYDICHLHESKFYPFIKEQKENSYFYQAKRQFFNAAAAYIITKRGAQKLLNHAYPYLGLPADDLISNTFVFDDNFKVIIPEKPLVTTGNFNSTIGAIN